MGLMIHSLSDMPATHDRSYYIYLLDYGWKEPLGVALRENFNRLARESSKQKDSVVIMSTDEGVHFTDEVFSWHHINGEDAEKEQLLPAVLVTNRHPSVFKSHDSKNLEDSTLKLILFPLKKYCSTTTQVIELMQKIFTNIKSGKDLKDFETVKVKKRGRQGALADAVIVQPSKTGIGFSFGEIEDFFKKNNQS